MDTSKIIKGVVSNGRYTVTAPIVKEDYGLYLKIEGVELPSTYEVDFSNSENNGTSVTMIGNADGVLIPHQFIDTGKDIFAFLYHVGADFGRTVYKFRIPNKCRPDRTNEEPTPEEQSVIDQAISALNEAVAQTAGDVESADQSAQNASADAESAEEARTDAQNYATQAGQATDDAQTYANNASASAEASAQSASQSAQIKADVEELADDAQGYASASAQSASASANSATSAQGYAQSASASAQSASGYASSAQASANTASTKAQDASQSASTASQKATESAQSASQASGYAQTAETAKTDAQTAKTQAETARDNAVTAKTAAETAQGKAEDAAGSVSASAAQIATNTSDISDLKEDLTSVSSRFEPLEPIIVNMYDYFWANGRPALSTRISTDADAKNLYLVVSGNEGASVVTVDSGSPLAFANLSTTPMAGIIEYSDGVDLISLYASNGTLTVYPPLKETIAGVKIYSLAVGIHLTEAGYKYYADCLYNTDRRYTRKNKAIAQYNAYIDYNPATSGITKIGSYWWGKGVRNITNEIFRVIMNGCKEYLNCSLTTGATASAPKGLEWEQNLAGKNGYFEMYIGGKDSTAMHAEFESGYEFHFEWYLDGILADSYIKKTKRLEAVRFDFADAQTGKIKFYVTAGQSGYEAWITQMTWWETDETNGKIFSDYKVPCLLMDSWGVYHDNAFQTRLVELLTENNGLPSHAINKSLGSTTSEWGLNNFYSRVWAEHPDYMITDFQINDVNTSMTQESFVTNMKKLIDVSLGTGIVPVLIMQGYNTTGGTYSPYTFPFLTELANLT